MTGVQTCALPIYNFVDYSYNGTNIRKADNGFGISMNLVNGASYFETDISANVRATSSAATAYGTYQHALTDVSLSASQSYTISHNGFGDVLNFATCVQMCIRDRLQTGSEYYENTNRSKISASGGAG